MNIHSEQSLSQTSSSFLSQVFLYFGLAIATSAFGTYVGFQYLAELFLTNPALIWITFAAELLLIFTSRLWSTKRPLNYVLFITFAFLTGVTLFPLLAYTMLEFGGFTIIVKALLATTFMFAGTAAFGWVTKRNLVGLGGFLWIALIGMIVVSIIGIFVPWSDTFEMFFAGIGIILFSAYTMYDIQRLKDFPHDRAMDAALMLYLDIFNLFIFILRLMRSANR